MNRRISFGFAVLVLLIAPSAWAQGSGGSGADPTGAAPLGVTVTSETRGPKLVGVIAAELVGVGTGTVASSARVTLRLRRGSQLAGIFTEVAGPLDTEDTADIQEAIREAIETKVKRIFFGDACGASGAGCPSADLLLKQAEEFVLTDDGVANQIFVADVVLAFDESL